MGLPLWIVIERIPYETKNVWIFASENEKQITDFLQSEENYGHTPAMWNTTINRISNLSEYEEFELISRSL